MIFKNFTKFFFINLFFVFLIFITDRISKIYVIYINDKSLSSELFSSKFLNIRLIWNEGIAFGLFSFDQNHLYNFLTIIILVVIFVILIMVIKNRGFKKYASIMIFGGAIGNLYDRIIFKAVPDFIDFHIGDFHWFIFNVADIFISIGVFFMILSEFFVKKQK
jgi:signal peptidase II